MSAERPWYEPGSFAGRLLVERRRLGYTQAALGMAGEAFGVSAPYTREGVRNWDRRQHGPHLAALAYLARLGFDVHFLASGVRALGGWLQCDEGLGVLRWPLPSAHPDAVIWSAQETRALVAARRAVRGGTMGPRLLADTFASTMAVRVAAGCAPLPGGGGMLTARLGALFVVWATHFEVATPPPVADAVATAERALQDIAVPGDGLHAAFRRAA